MYPADNAFMRELLTVFAGEADERLATIDQRLLTFERTSASDERLALLHDIKRELHTLKGSSGAVNLPDASRLAHALEHLFNGVDPEGLTDATTIDMAYKGLDGLRHVITCHVDDADPTVDLEGLLTALEHLDDREISATSPVAEDARRDAAADDPPPARHVEPTQPSTVPATEGNAPSALLDAMVADPAPGADLTATVVNAQWTPVAETPAPPAADDESRPRRSGGRQADETVRLTTTKLDSLMARVGELVVARIGSERRVDEVREVVGLVIAMKSVEGHRQFGATRLPLWPCTDQSVSNFTQRTVSSAKPGADPIGGIVSVAHFRPRRIVVREHAGHAVVEHPRRAARRADHVEQHSRVEAEALAERHGLRARGQVDAGQQVVDELDARGIADARAHAVQRRGEHSQQGLAALEHRGIGGDHHRQRSVRGTRRAAGNRRVDHCEAARADAPGKVGRVGRADGRAQHDDAARLERVGDALRAEAHFVGLPGVNHHRDHDVGAGGDFGWRRANRGGAGARQGIARGVDVAHEYLEAAAYQCLGNAQAHGAGADQSDALSHVISRSKRGKSGTVE